MMLLKNFPKSCAFMVQAAVWWCLVSTAQAQVFTLPANGWRSAGDVTVPLSKPHTIIASPGDGILVHTPDRRGRSEALETTAAYGDLTLELSYLLAEGTTATLHLPGGYPITLADNRGLISPNAQSNGGAAGYAPRQLVGRAPGLWQRLQVAFRAPQFDADGSVVSPAQLARVVLNGVTIHEEVQLVAPAAGSGNGPVRLDVAEGAMALKDVAIAELPAAAGTQQRDSPDPILVQAQVNTTHRSFMDIPGGPRVVHAISVGHPQQIHYTYDLDKGSLFQVWRGGFLDATPMWNNRGNGTARVLGSPVHFGAPNLTVAKLGGVGDPWPLDTAGTGYKPNGYVMDHADLPTFRYHLYGQQVADAIRPLADGSGFTRTLTVAGDTDGLYVRLAVAPAIADQGKGVFLIGDNAWYLRVEETGKGKPFVREGQSGQELLVPAAHVIRYSIIF